MIVIWESMTAKTFNNMKKILLLLLFLPLLSLFFAISCKASIQKDSVSDTKIVETALVFPDLQFKNYLLENFDINKDGEISIKEALLVKYIYCESLRT